MPQKVENRLFLEEAQGLQIALFNNLKLRKRAVGNWKRLQIMLTLMRLSGNNITNTDFTDTYRIDNPIENIEEDEGTSKTCKEKIAPYIIISPKSSYKIAWDILIGCVYLTCYIIDPLVYSFHFDILVHYPDLNRF